FVINNELLKNSFNTASLLRDLTYGNSLNGFKQLLSEVLEKIYSLRNENQEEESFLFESHGSDFIEDFFADLDVLLEFLIIFANENFISSAVEILKSYNQEKGVSLVHIAAKFNDENVLVNL